MRRFAAWCLAFCMCLGVISEGSVLTVHAKETRPSYKIMVNRAANCVTVYEQDANGILYTFSVLVIFLSFCAAGFVAGKTPNFKSYV